MVEHVPAKPGEITSITLAFGDGHYRFWLPMKEANQLEQQHGSILALWSDLGEAIGEDPVKGPTLLPASSRVILAQVRAIIRLAAQGGNRRIVAGHESSVSPVDATALVTDFVDDRPLSETLPIAWAILDAAVWGRTGTRPGDAMPIDPVDAQL